MTLSPCPLGAFVFAPLRGSAPNIMKSMY
jgi:hypothetical protein